VLLSFGFFRIIFKTFLLKFLSDSRLGPHVYAQPTKRYNNRLKFVELVRIATVNNIQNEATGTPPHNKSATIVVRPGLGENPSSGSVHPPPLSFKNKWHKMLKLTSAPFWSLPATSRWISSGNFRIWSVSHVSFQPRTEDFLTLN